MSDETMTDGIGAAEAKGNEHTWRLRLYIAGHTPRSVSALANLTKICEQYLAGQYDIEVIDLLKCPELASDDQILAIPTVVRKLPKPEKKVIGDLSNLDRALAGLNIR